MAPPGRSGRGRLHGRHPPGRPSLIELAWKSVSDIASWKSIGKTTINARAINPGINQGMALAGFRRAGAWIWTCTRGLPRLSQVCRNQ